MCNLVKTVATRAAFPPSSYFNCELSNAFRALGSRRADMKMEHVLRRKSKGMNIFPIGK